MVRHLNALSGAHEIDGMHADHITAADGLNADFLLGALSDDAFAVVAGNILEDRKSVV